MATHNQIRLVGYLKEPPKIMNINTPGAEKVICKVRTTRRDIDGYEGPYFEDVLVFYDSQELMPKMLTLKQYDVVDIKGVVNVMTVNKRTQCPNCGTVNYKMYGASVFVYPISLIKLNSLATFVEDKDELPDEALRKRYLEVSNQAIIIGTVVREPAMIGNERVICCKYPLGVDRKYYISTQSQVTADYPWIYSYHQQAESDMRHLQPGTLVMIDGFMHSRSIKCKMTCDNCQSEYEYPDYTTCFVPYSVEYLNGYKTDEDIAREEELKRREAIYAQGNLLS